MNLTRSLSGAVGALTLLVASPALSAGLSCSALPKALNGKSLTLGEAKMVADDPNAPAYCLIQGKAGERTGVDGKTYAIGFEMRLPVAWNGRFLHQVNGGNDGEVIPAIGDGKNLNAVRDLSALARGFAVLSSDSGHDGKDPTNKPAGLAAGAMFGFDPKARSDYGYAADATMAVTGKQIIARYYGSAPHHSYMMGCSNGGRHAMVAATRLADQYDGFVAGNPGFNLPRAGLQHAWDVQAFRAVDPDIKKALTREDMALISAKILEKCDALDGLADGMVQDVKACQAAFKIEDLTCKDGANQCLPANKVAAINKIMSGPHNSKGEQLYSEWAYDASMNGADWRMWKLESPIPPWGNNPIIAVMGSSSLGQIFTTPPVEVKGEPSALIDYLSHFDFDKDAPKIYAKGKEVLNGKTVAYNESAMDFMTPPDVDNPMLTRLVKRKGKLIVYHGVSDGVFSFLDTAHWYDKLNANHGGKAADFARLFPVPGMNHCRGGMTADNFDMLGPVVAWAEAGEAPDRIVAGVRTANRELPESWSRERTRPLCPWPQVARYESGDKEKAASFTCK